LSQTTTPAANGKFCAVWSETRFLWILHFSSGGSRYGELTEPSLKTEWIWDFEKPIDLLLGDLGDQIYHLTLRNTTVRTRIALQP